MDNTWYKIIKKNKWQQKFESKLPLPNLIKIDNNFLYGFYYFYILMERNIMKFKIFGHSW